MTPLHHRDTATARDMVFGVGITLALFAAASVLPIFGLAGVLMLPLPVLVYRLKLGRKKGAAIPAIAFAVMALLLGGGSPDLFLFLAMLMLGFVLGESFERNFSLEKTMLMACGTLMVAGLLVLLFYSHMANVGIYDLVSAYVGKNLSLYQDAVEKIGASEETKQAISTSIVLIESVILRILPGILVSGILFTSWITLLLARPVLQHTGLTYPDFGRLIRWRAPEVLVWVLIGCGALLMMPADGLKLIGLNSLMIVLQVYFFQGIAIVSFFFERKRLPMLLRWGLYTLMTLQVFLLVIVIGLGLFDTWMNVRKLDSGNDTPQA